MTKEFFDPNTGIMAGIEKKLGVSTVASAHARRECREVAA